MAPDDQSLVLGRKSIYGLLDGKLTPRHESELNERGALQEARQYHRTVEGVSLLECERAASLKCEGTAILT